MVDFKRLVASRKRARRNKILRNYETADFEIDVIFCESAFIYNSGVVT